MPPRSDLPRVRVQAGSSRLPAASMSSTPLPPPPTTPHVGASVGRRLGTWRPTPAGPNAVVQASGPELVRRSRDARRNIPYAKRAIGLIGTHVVGIGIKPRSLCRNEKTRQALGELWVEWTTMSDADGVLDFYGQQALATTEMAEAGETFARMRARRLSDGLVVPMQVQLLPAEQVPLEYCVPNGVNSVLQGIERDPLNRRVAYWCRSVHPNDYTGGVQPVDVMPRPVPAADMCHLYNQTRIGQLRGLPWLAAGLAVLKQFSDYNDAELLRKQLAASVVAFVKKSIGDDVSPAEMAAAWGTLQEQLGDLPTVSMEPGTVQYLNPGESVEFAQPADVGANYEAFINSSLRTVAASIDALYEEMTGNWKDTNDRTFRAQFNTFRRQVQQWQYTLLVAQFCQPIRKRFIEYALASGALKQPKSVNDADLNRVAWLPQRHEYIQPVQDVEATGLELAYGLTSRTSAAAERGDDVEDIDDQVAADHARERKKGLTYAIGIAKAPAGKQNDSGPGKAGPDQTGQEAP